jgi:hypothetical protein
MQSEATDESSCISMTVGEMGFDFIYVQDVDRAEYHNFCLHHLRTYGRQPVEEVWHYTTAEGLIAILREGKIFSTQITCLNDNREQRYFGDLLHEAMKPLILRNTDPDFGVFLKIADEALAQRDFATAYHFVSCFSEAQDDLGQWRGYGGGSCGYAIGFRSDGLLEALKSRPSAIFLPMQYADTSHRFVVDDTMRMAEIYFHSGIKKHGVTNMEQWSREFLIAFAMQLDIFASTTKHPAFASEKERRIVAPLQSGEHNNLEFRQKNTLLARHLPIDLTIDVDGQRRLPISRICVGPSPAQRVTQVSVADLLLKFGYKGVPVELSAAPYRIP